MTVVISSLTAISGSQRLVCCMFIDVSEDTSKSKIKPAAGSDVTPLFRLILLRRREEKWVVVRDTTGGGNRIYHRF
jgi:hypothetical protein